jgi:AhpD family alkylhydroperoxidase
MEKRINIQQLQPEAYKGMYVLGEYLQTTQLTNSHKNLIKVRASQINGCAFCINMHTKEARATGESEQRIYLLNAWRETNLYTEEERAILALTEEVTLIHQNGVTNETYQQAEKLFSKEYLAQVIMAIVTYNAWNRIAISTQMEFNN